MNIFKKSVSIVISLVALFTFGLPLAALCEGTIKEPTPNLKSPKKSIKKAPLKKKTDEKRASTPDEPYPYTQLIDGAPKQAVVESAPQSTPKIPYIQSPVAQTVPYDPSAPRAENVLDLPDYYASEEGQKLLRCKTTVFENHKALSEGQFLLSLEPIDINNKSKADFRFVLPTPTHQSLIRETICLDIVCSAEMSAIAYFLVGQSDSRGYLRITLDRRQGTFNAESQTSAIGGFNKRVRYETGQCVLITSESPKF